MRIAKVKITENDDLTGSTLRIWMNPSCKFFETTQGHKTVSFWYLTFWIYTFIRRAFCVFSTNFSQRNRSSRRWNLFTHNIIFTDKRDFSSSVSRQFHGYFLLFLDSLEFWFLFLTVFVRFFLLLASRYARDSRGVNTKSEITPCYAARPYKFGNIEQGWSWKGLQEQTNHRTSYQCKKPSKMYLFETVAMETETTLYTLRKINIIESFRSEFTANL